MFTAHDMKPSITIYNNVGNYNIRPVSTIRAPKNGESLESVVNESPWSLSCPEFGNMVLFEGTFAECVEVGIRDRNKGMDFNGWGYKYDAVNYKGRVDLEGEAQTMFSKIAPCKS